MPSVLFAGLSTIDIQFFVDQFPGSNEKVKCKAPDILVGGPALNAAVAYSFLNGEAQLLTAVGDNPFKSIVTHDLCSCGVQLIDFVQDEAISPVIASVITSGNGDRSILSHHPEDHPVKFDVESLFNKLQPELVMVDGFYPQMTFAICEEAKRRGVLTVFDGGSWKPHLKELIPLLDLIVCSADFMPPGCKSHADVFYFFEQYQKKQVAISRGSEPILYLDGNQLKDIEVESIGVKDSLGAGDFLHGGFCYYWLKTKNFAQSLKLAGLFASQTCLHEGTRKCFDQLEKDRFI